MAKPEGKGEKNPILFSQAEDYSSIYANNSRFQTSNWDLKIVFGELDQSKGSQHVVQKMAVTLPWPQAKVLHYFLTLNLIAHEGENQRIMIPTGLISEFPSTAPPEVNQEAFAKARKFYEDFISENPEAAPIK